MNILESIQKNDMLKVLLILAGVYFFMTYYYKEALENVNSSATTVPVSVQVPVVQPQVAPGSLASAPVMSAQQQQVDSIVAGPTQLTTSDLLPKYDDASDFAKQNPVSKILQEQNFLQAGYHIGINTQIQSNKIPYLDIRSMPPIPKQEAGPWMQSSFEEPVGAKRRHLEIGQ
jgi:predicted transcriptional regulator